MFNPQYGTLVVVATAAAVSVAGAVYVAMARLPRPLQLRWLFVDFSVVATALCCRIGCCIVGSPDGEQGTLGR